MEESMIIQETPITFTGDFLGNQLYIKREDLIPFSFGGNKVRIAFEYFQNMVSLDKDCLVGYGNARSNLCRVLANLSTAKHIPCHIISPDDDDGTRVDTSNSKMVELCGTKVHTCSKSEVAETVERVLKDCACQGYRPYYIYGNKYGKGREAVPVRAYAKTYQEICRQEQNLKIKFDSIFLATGTGMTQSGLIAGAELQGDIRDIVGISVARNREQERQVIEGFLSAYLSEKHVRKQPENKITVCDDYLSGGYGKYNDRIVDVIEQSFLHHGIPMDTTYVGKGYYGMQEYIKQSGITGKKILFIHTGGTPLFLDYLGRLTGGHKK